MHPVGPVAAIDCGTNSTRLLVADADGPTARRATCASPGWARAWTPPASSPPSAIERCLSVLGEYRAVMDKFGVVRGRLVATSAARDAANGDEFLAAAGVVTGFAAELLSGDEEGRLSMAGAVSDCDPAGAVPRPRHRWRLDRAGHRNRPDDPAPAAVSLQVGCVRITERFLARDPPTAGRVASGRVDGRTDCWTAASADHPRCSPPGRWWAWPARCPRCPRSTWARRLRPGPDPPLRADCRRSLRLVPAPWPPKSERPGWTVPAWSPGERT